MMPYKLVDLIDINKLQVLLDCLDRSFTLATAILDNEGNILTASGWQDICTKFHRVYPVCAEECKRSDLYILNHINESTHSFTYKCLNGLVDSATPIIINGKHLGNVFIGQFLLETPNLDYFRVQAQKYGFDENAYLEALSKVPVITSYQMEQRLTFIKGLAEYIGKIGLQRLWQIESEQRLSEAQSIAHLGSWEYDLEKNNLIWSDETYRIFGIHPQEFTPSYEAFLDVVHPDDRANVNKVYIESVKQGTPYEIEHRIIRRSDGNIRYIFEKSKHVKDKTGKIIKSSGIVYDITDLKNAEEELRKSEDKFSRAFRSSPVVMSISTLLDGRFLEVNDAFTKVMGYSAEETIGHTSAELNIWVNLSDRNRIIDQLQAGELVRDIEVQLRIKSGDIHTMLFSGEIIELGSEKCLLLTIFDVTESKKAEDALKESEERLRTLINVMPDIVCFKDGKGCWQEANDFDLQLFELTGVDYYGKKDSELAEFSAFYRDAFLACEDTDERAWQAGKATRSDEVIPVPDKPSRVFDIIKIPTYYPDGNRKGLVVVGRDITERIHAEEERRSLEEHLEKQKRLFYRDSILSVTDGKLEICDLPDIESYISMASLQVNILNVSDVPTVRHRVKEFCELNGLVGSRLDSFMDGVGEAIANAIKHGINGNVYGGSTNDAVWVAVADKGSGIESLILPRAILSRGFSTKPSMGLGYTIILDVADHVMLDTGPNGTTVLMKKSLVEQVFEINLNTLPDTWASIDVNCEV